MKNYKQQTNQWKMSLVKSFLKTSLKLVIFTVKKFCYEKLNRNKQIKRNNHQLRKDFPVSICLFQVNKKMLQRYWLAHNQQQKHQNKFNNVFLFSKSQTPSTLKTPCISILTSNKHISLVYYKTFMTQE